MDFEPKTKEQITHEQEERLKNLIWPAGIYDFRVISEVTFGTRNVSTSDSKSKSGTDMIVLVLELMNESGGKKVIIDYLVAAIPEKLYSISMTCGLNYKSGQLYASDFLGKSGRVQIKVEKGKAKPDNSGNYPDKNEVVIYIEEAAKFTNNAPQTNEPDFDIPIEAYAGGY